MTDDPHLSDRQQMAQRLHQLLLHELSYGIDVAQLLNEPLYARDVLLVCEALRGTELATLAADYRRASAGVLGALAAGSLAPGHVLQSTDWSRNTSGFGPLTQPPPQDADSATPSVERRRGWAPPWRRR